jgi:hypothetical protein
MENNNPIYSDSADENCGSRISMFDTSSNVIGSVYVNNYLNGFHDMNIEYIIETTNDELSIPPILVTFHIVNYIHHEEGEDKILELCWYVNVKEQDDFELFIDVIYQEWMVRSPLNGWLFERTYL